MTTEEHAVLSTQQRDHLGHFLKQQPPTHKPPTHKTNDVSDIPGAQPLLKNHMYFHKPHFHDANDIAGSTSKQLHPVNRRVGADERYQQRPIEGSWPQPSGFRTNRVINPLAPEYKLPSFKPMEPVIPKFLRDSFDVSDIDGTKFKKKEIQHPRNPMQLSDIPGSQAGWLPRHKQSLKDHPPRNILDVHDIINVDFKSTRVTNVLDPVYVVNGFTSQDDQFSKPAIQHPARRNKPFFPLETHDIAGANAYDAAKNVVGGVKNQDRRNFRVTNRVDDICGAQADTTVHSIRSQRRTNPNAPEYVALDGTHVDSSAISAAKSIVFADMVQEYDRKWRIEDEDDSGPYIVSGISNIGMTGHQDRKSKKTKRLPPTIVNAAPTSRAAMSFGENRPSRMTPQEKKQHAMRQEEIRLVRDLS